MIANKDNNSSYSWRIFFLITCFVCFIPFVIIRFVPLYLWLLFVMSLYTFCRYTFCLFLPFVFIHFVVIRFVFVYVLSLYVLSFIRFVVTFLFIRRLKINHEIHLGICVYSWVQHCRTPTEKMYNRTSMQQSKYHAVLIKYHALIIPGGVLLEAWIFLVVWCLSLLCLWRSLRQKRYNTSRVAIPTWNRRLVGLDLIFRDNSKRWNATKWTLKLLMLDGRGNLLVSGH